MKRQALWPMVLLLGMLHSPAQPYSILYHFPLQDVRAPAGVVAWQGGLFGTTRYPDGACFRMDENGANVQVLHLFGSRDGQYPEARLLTAGTILYGTTKSGGAVGCGAIFSLETNTRLFSLLRSFSAGTWAGNYFTNEDGSDPDALLTSGSRLFGTAASGGHGSFGTVYSVATNGTDLTVLHHFANGSDGARPGGNLLLVGDQLYGATHGGGDNKGGTLFSLDTKGDNFSVIHTFSANYYASYKFTNADGFAPTGSLITDGTYLYGVASSGGLFGNGTVFRLKPDGSDFSVLKHFSADFTPGTGTQPNPDGSEPIGGLLLFENWLYGVAYGGGSQAFGTLYSLRPDGASFHVLHHFSPSTDGYCLNGGLSVSGHTLFGSATCGGAYNNGVVFALTLAPRFLAAVRDGDKVDLTCNLLPGRLHLVQYASDPASPDWNNLGAPFTATNSELHVVDTLRGDTQRFYRIQMSP